MPWMPPVNRIDIEQRSVLDSMLRGRGHRWIRGFAGSGKSVLLMQSLSEVVVTKPKSKACVVTFTHALKDMLRNGLRENVRDVPVMTYHEFRRQPERYDYIFVDEVQDLEPGILELLAEHCDVLTVCGDEEQSIYENRISPQDIRRVIRDQEYALRGVYRLTQRLIQVVASILPEAKLLTAQTRRLQSEVRISLAKATSRAEELSWVLREAQRFAFLGEPSAILVPSARLAKSLIRRACSNAGVDVPEFPRTGGGRFQGIDYSIANKHMARNGLALRYLGSSYGELEEGERRRIVFLMTYHSAKGLDFETVFLPGLDEGMQIWRGDQDMERRLLYVAATRSRRNLFVSYSEHRPHRLIQSIPQGLVENIRIMKASENEGQVHSNDEVF